MARKNERGLLLSFKRSGDGTKGRWYTRVGGKPAYFGWGNGVSDRESYQTALASYRAWQAKQAEAAKLGTRGPAPEGFGSWSQLEGAYAQWGEAIAKGNRAVAGEKAVSKLIDSWLEDQKKRNERRHWVEAQRAAGKQITEGARENLSDGRYAAYAIYGEHFKKAVGDMKWDGAEAACAAIIKVYREQCEKLLHEGANKPNTFNERMKTVRAFVTWADENYQLDRVPRAITKLTSKFAYAPSAKAISVSTIKIIWENANDNMKAYIALALNCGYYAIDIAVLQADDIRDGRIVRNRNKTGVPTNYKLWDVTRKLIAKVGNKEGSVFLGENGNILVRHSGKTRIDAIADRWDRLLRKLTEGEEKKLQPEEADFSFTNLRDTSTTFVEDKDPSLSDTFDAHTDRRQAKYYIDPTALQHRQAKLDAVIADLERFYGLKWKKVTARSKSK